MINKIANFFVIKRYWKMAAKLKYDYLVTIKNTKSVHTIDIIGHYNI